ncbi:hypothetical protein BC941DRAFT_475470 [Chlamydoabsidia padenii]|nr:hypothetical protein BC941DRAFT_475470 [Chlamydoabsidia padenii]
MLRQMYRQIDKADYDSYESKYNKDLSALMNQYHVKTKDEMIPGFVMTWRKRDNKKSDCDLLKQTAVEAMRADWHQSVQGNFSSFYGTMS